MISMDREEDRVRSSRQVVRRLVAHPARGDRRSQMTSDRRSVSPPRPKPGAATPAARFCKAALDRSLAALALLLSAPLLATIVLLIKLDSPGPVLYHQKRHGLGGRIIEVLKFRTMYVEECDPPHGPIVQVRRSDPRVTRVGRMLRRHNLDELPQLWNVLLGSMSLVGPRPHPLSLERRFASATNGYASRYRVRPGITGWAQINGCRGETETVEKMARRVEYDLHYVENWSLLLDLRILVLTVISMVRRADDAY
jgi:putative colanic acid biosysnthesis UDP-glucose lipid carrier transferase